MLETSEDAQKGQQIDISPGSNRDFSIFCAFDHALFCACAKIVSRLLKVVETRFLAQNDRNGHVLTKNEAIRALTCISSEKIGKNRFLPHARGSKSLNFDGSMLETSFERLILLKNHIYDNTMYINEEIVSQFRRVNNSCDITQIKNKHPVHESMQ